MKRFLRAVGFQIAVSLTAGVALVYLRPKAEKLAQKAYFKYKKFKHRKKDIRNVVKIK